MNYVITEIMEFQDLSAHSMEFNGIPTFMKVKYGSPRFTFVRKSWNSKVYVSKAWNSMEFQAFVDKARTSMNYVSTDIMEFQDLSA